MGTEREPTAVRISENAKEKEKPTMFYNFAFIGRRTYFCDQKKI